MTTDPYLYETIRRALGVANSGPFTLVPAPTNVVSLKTSKAWYPPDSLARTLQDIDDAFAPRRTDG